MGMVEEQRELALIPGENQEALLGGVRQMKDIKQVRGLDSQPLNDAGCIIVSHEAKRQRSFGKRRTIYVVLNLFLCLVYILNSVYRVLLEMPFFM